MVDVTTRGNLRAFPTGTGLPSVSTLNFGATVGYPVANAAIDVNGYFAEGVVTSVMPGTGLSGKTLPMGAPAR